MGDGMQTFDNPRGNYRFLGGIAPYSSGVIAMSGHEIVRASLHRPLPVEEGFHLIDRHLAAAERPAAALCAIELRLPAPLDFEGFADFNEGYLDLLRARDLLVDGKNPIARTNVAPSPPVISEPSLFAFSYTHPVDDAGASFIVAGAGDVADQGLSSRRIVREGETSPAAAREKAEHVMARMSERLTGLGAGWSMVTAVDVYTTLPIQPFLAEVIVAPLGANAVHGVHWYYSEPPIKGLAFEMDVRGIGREIRLFE